MFSLEPIVSKTWENVFHELNEKLPERLIAYFIIISTASTLFVHHQNITTAADAARSLEPLLGPIAKYLIAFGLIGAGLVAIPVLLASTSYALAGTFRWPAGRSKKRSQKQVLYLILPGR